MGKKRPNFEQFREIINEAIKAESEKDQSYKMHQAYHFTVGYYESKKMRWWERLFDKVAKKWFAK